MPLEPAASLLVPDGACLLHVGPPKTGTTSLQAAFFAARAATLAQGVRYAGRSRHESVAAQAVGRSLDGRPDPPTIAEWHRVAGEVSRAREPRVVLSSETLSYANEAAARRIVDDLAPRQVHLVVTLRPLSRILPSAWQQFVKNGIAMPYEPWLEATLGDGPSPTPLFWRQQRHDALVERWAATVGRERVTVVVVDERDRDGLLRTFEAFTGLAPGTLRQVEDLGNRSLTAGEVEAIRALNDRLRAEGFTRRDIDRIVRGQAAEYALRRHPDPAEARILTPAWAVDRARELEAEVVRGLRASGVRVVGDLASLVTTSAGEPRADVETPTASPEPAAGPAGAGEAGAWLAVGMYHAGRRDPDLDRVRVRVLAGAILRRVPTAVRRRLGRRGGPHRGAGSSGRPATGA